MTPTQAVCAAILAATKPLSAAEIADVATVDRQKVSTIVWSLAKGGTIKAVKLDGEPIRYKIVNQDDLQQRSDGKAARRTKRHTQVTTDPPPPKKERKAKKAKKRAARPVPVESERVFSYFLDEDCDLQIMRRDGIGDAAIVPKPEALQLLAFLDRHRAALEAA
jgi:hypothetical protein